jgi:hypothetical protein
MLMSTPAGPDDGFNVVVSDDGTLTVPAAELARHGVRPGAHLRLIPAQRHARPKRLLGALKDTVPAAAVEQLIRGLDESKAERTAYYGESARDT